MVGLLVLQLPLGVSAMHARVLHRSTPSKVRGWLLGCCDVLAPVARALACRKQTNKRQCRPCLVVPSLCSMLRYYLTRHRNASLLVPIGGINAMANLCRMTGGRLFMLCGALWSRPRGQRVSSFAVPRARLHAVTAACTREADTMSCGLVPVTTRQRPQGVAESRFCC